MRYLLAVLLFLAAFQAAPAADSIPTEVSIRELMTLVGSRKLVESLMGQVDSMTQDSAQQALHGHAITPDQQKMLDELRTKMVTVLGEEMRWEILEPIYIDIYKKSFTQQELDGILAFYKSEPGRAAIAKMPIVMQRTLQATKNRIDALAPRLEALQRDFMAQLEASQKK